MSFDVLVMGGALIYSCPRKREKGDGNGADDNRVRTGKGWDKQDGRVMRGIRNNLTKKQKGVDGKTKDNGEKRGL